MDDIVTALLDFSQRFASQAGEVLLAFAAIGTLTMAVIQAIKDLTRARRVFNRNQVTRWLDRVKDPPPTDDNVSLMAAIAHSPHALLDLLVLATAADADALFDLEIEKVAGQMNAAAGIVVDYPDLHVNLLRRLAAGARDGDIELLISTGQGGRAALEQLRLNARDEYDIFLDAKTRVTHQVQRNLDGFQISATFAWKTRLKWAAFVLSVAFAWIAVSIAGKGFLVSLPIGIAAGFFAPIARDLVAVLDKAKRR